eukprot:gene10474-2996_t
MKRVIRKYSTLKEKELLFKCTGCGKCCQVEGICSISSEDTKKISSFLQMKTEDFLEKYTMKNPDEYCDEEDELILKNKSNSNDCIFLDETKKCKIYPVRPIQCSTYPFWNSILKSKEKWVEESKYCEGIK